MIFLICPVRNITDSQKAKIADYVYKLESNGSTVYWPYRDTDQNDPIGDRICTDNKEAIKKAQEIHIWWSETSTGTLFDLGIAWAMDKPLVIANPEDVKETENKSFQNVLLNWQRRI